MREIGVNLEEELAEIIQHTARQCKGTWCEGAAIQAARNILYILERDWRFDKRDLEYQGRPWQREGEE